MNAVIAAHHCLNNLIVSEKPIMSYKLNSNSSVVFNIMDKDKI